MSSAEIVVAARLLPRQVDLALGELERLGLVNSWIPVTGMTGDKVSVLTDDGRLLLRGLEQVRGTPPVGTVIRVPASFPSFSGWLSGRQSSSQVEIAADPV